MTKPIDFLSYFGKGVATAFAARDILGNMLSGFSLQFSKPFSIGDNIKVPLSISLLICQEEKFYVSKLQWNL